MELPVTGRAIRSISAAIVYTPEIYVIREYFLLIRLPARKYPAAAAPPATASKSPRHAVSPAKTFHPPMTAAPDMTRINPIQKFRDTFSRKTITEYRAANKGLVVTNTMELVTPVRESEVIQNMKCRDSIREAMDIRPISRHRIPLASARNTGEKAAKGRINNEENNILKAATEAGGASASLMNMEANETETMAAGIAAYEILSPSALIMAFLSTFSHISKYC